MVHVHVYAVIRKAEIAVKTDDAKFALRVALKEAKNNELAFAEPDCQFVACAFDKEGREHIGK